MVANEILSIICSGLYSDPNMEGYVTLARDDISQCFFGANYEKAVALMAAHSYTLNTIRQSESGVITYKAAGRMMQSYGGVGVIRDDLELTNYGMQLKGLIRKSSVGASVTSEFAVESMIGSC